MHRQSPLPEVVRDERGAEGASAPMPQVALVPGFETVVRAACKAFRHRLFMLHSAFLVAKKRACQGTRFSARRDLFYSYRLPTFRPLLNIFPASMHAVFDCHISLILLST